MKSSRIGTFLRPPVAIAITTFALANLCSAGVILSETGTLSSPEDTFVMALNLATAADVTLQTYGFGGGTNGAGTIIPSGGFDPFVGLFSGTGATSTWSWTPGSAPISFSNAPRIACPQA